MMMMMITCQSFAPEEKYAEFQCCRFTASHTTMKRSVFSDFVS